MAPDYPEIIASTKTTIEMTHTVRYMTRYMGLPSSKSSIMTTSIRLPDGDESMLTIQLTLRKQLGLDKDKIIEIVSVGPFKGYANA